MYLWIEAHPNPDIPGGFWEPHLVENMPRKLRVNVDGLKRASQVFQQFTADYGLGGGNCPSAYVYEDDGELTARISYNGRIWAII